MVHVAGGYSAAVAVPGLLCFYRLIFTSLRNCVTFLLVIFGICFQPLSYLLSGHLLSGRILNHLMYPNVSKCSAKRCVCCTNLCTKTTIASSVNGRQLSIINCKDMDSDLCYNLK